MCQCGHPHDDHDPAGFCKSCGRACGVDRRTVRSPLQHQQDGLLRALEGTGQLPDEIRRAINPDP